MFTETDTACEDQVEHLSADTVDRRLDGELVELLSYCFTGLERVRRRHRRFIHTLPADRWTMRNQRGGLIAHVAGREVVLGMEGTSMAVAGISDVCVHPAYRRQGRMKQLLAAVHGWAAQRRLAYAMLFGAGYLYESSGYERIENPIRRWDADLATWTESPMRGAMVKRLGGVGFPEGVVDLRGPVF